MNSKTPMKNQKKGYAKESASQERSNLLNVNPLSKHMSTPMQMGGSKSYGSPVKNVGMKYDIKEASNQSLSKSARKHYAENAQAASKSGYKG